MKLTAWHIVAPVLGVGAFLAGRASVRVDDRKLLDSLAVYRAHRKDDAAENARMRNALADEYSARLRSEAATVSMIESAARLVSGAAKTMVSANEKQRLADSLLASLKHARTAGDTITILTNACTERGNECALVRRANDSLFKAADSLSGANDESKQTIASFRRDSATLVKRINRDSLRLRTADSLLTQFEKNARGCRIPLIDFPCPVGTVSYDLEEPGKLSDALKCSAGFPIKPWLIASITARCIPKRKP